MTFDKFVEDLCRLDTVLAIDVGLAYRRFRADTGGRAAASSARSAPSNNVKVLNLFGVLSQFGQYPDGTSTYAFGQEFDRAMRDKSVSGVLIHVDSPGGTVTGTAELADKIYSARGTKPVVATVSGSNASAAYWISSAADRIIAQPSSEVGSIGVWNLHQNFAEAEKQLGIETTIISSKGSPYKVEGNPWEKLSAEARSEMQRRVDVMHDQFVRTVARNRGTTESKVRTDFGRGRMVMSDGALARGMIDGIGTIDDTMQRMTYGLNWKQPRASDFNSNDPVVLRARLRAKHW